MKSTFLRFSIILILTPILLTISACSDEEPSRRSFFRPQSWIQGTWVDDNGTDVGFTFTANNFLQDAPQAIDFNAILNAADINDQRAEVVETSELDQYRVDIYEGDNRYNYNFNKVSSTQIRWTNPPAPSPQVTMSRK